MINARVRVTSGRISDGLVRSEEFWLGGDSLDGVLASDIEGMLETDRRPRETGDDLRLTLLGAWFVHAGLRTFRVKKRTIRRAAERLWPLDTHTPEVHRAAAFILLTHGSCVIRLSPFHGLVATRD